MNRAEERFSTGRSVREGDVVVTALAHHYAVGRIGTDGRTQEHLASEKNRAVALHSRVSLPARPEDKLVLEPTTPEPSRVGESAGARDSAAREV